MFVIAVKKWRNTKCIKRNAFEQTLFAKYSKSFTTAKFQHNMVGVQFTTEQRTFMVLEYNLTGFPERLIERFEERFPGRQPPCTRTILRNFMKYSTHGTSQNWNTEKSGRWRTTRSVNNINTVHEALRRDPRISARRKPTGLSKTTFNRITKLELK